MTIPLKIAIKWFKQEEILRFKSQYGSSTSTKYWYKSQVSLVHHQLLKFIARLSNLRNFGSHVAGSSMHC